MRRGLGIEISHAFLFDLSKVEPIEDNLSDFEYRFLSSDDVCTFVADPTNDLDTAMADRLAAGRNVCFAALDGPRLANYNWYAFDGIEAEHAMRVPLVFGPDIAYLFKGFTHPDYRGRRLNYSTARRGFDALAQMGLKRVMGIIEYGNWTSLSSYGRFRPEHLGLLVTLGRDGMPRWRRVPPRARTAGIEFGRELAACHVGELSTGTLSTSGAL